MKRLLMPVASIAAIVLLGSCAQNTISGSGKKDSQTRAVRSFNEISISVPLTANITVQPGAQPSVQLSGYENMINNIQTDVDGNALRIHMKQGWSFNNNKEVVATITVPSLTALSLDGAPDANITGSITGNEFKLDISGAASVNIDNISVNKFTSDVSGAGDLNIKGGNVELAAYDLSGAGTIKAFGLQTSESEATVSGAGTTELSASKKLSANISGVGSIKYKGHPEVVSDISGVGTLKNVE